MDPLEAQSELHDGERDVWPDPHDDRVGSPELRGNRDAVEGPGTERVDHVQPADVEDHPARPELPDLLDQVILELDHLGVGEGRLDAGDQVRALLQDGGRHREMPLPLGVALRFPSPDHLIGQQSLRFLDPTL